MQVVAADLKAIYDVAALLTEQSDQLSAEDALIMMEEAKKAQQALKLAIDMLESQALRSIEQPILIGRTAWSKVPVMKRRPRADVIDKTVVRCAAMPDEDGVLPTAFEAAQNAVDIMKGLYVAPSTVPKVGGVKKIGLEFGEVIDEELTGYELKRTEIE